MKPFALVACGLLASPVLAQQTLIVDAAGGPGSQFTDIQPAVDAAQTGDLVQVRPGTYTRFTVAGKGIRVAGERGGAVTVVDGVTVTTVPAGTATTLSGFEVVDGATVHALQIRSNRGAVHVDGLSLTGDTISIDDSALVSMTNCTGEAVSISRSDVQLAQCSFVHPGFVLPGILVQANARVTIQSCTAVGGSGIGFPPEPPAPGLRVCSADVVVAGESTLTTGPTGGSQPGAAVQLFCSGNITIDPGVRLQPNPGAPPTEGLPVTFDTVPAVEASSPPIEGPLTGFVRAATGSLAVVLVAPPANGRATALGEVWLGSPAAVVDAGPVGVGGLRAFRLDFPAVVPAGVALTAQAFAQVPRQPWRASTPSTFVTRL
ncbi:MAG: hypothetical protein AAF628_22275 [Planctomycetota bacterium]